MLKLGRWVTHSRGVPENNSANKGKLFTKANNALTPSEKVNKTFTAVNMLKNAARFFSILTTDDQCGKRCSNTIQYWETKKTFMRLSVLRGIS